MMRNVLVLGCAVLLAVGLSISTFAGAFNDPDGDGVPDFFDNCTNAPNGPLGATNSCNAQEDGNLDGFGNACDRDLNNDGGTALDDAAQAFANITGPPFPGGDVNCDGGQALDDAAIVFGAVAIGNPPGPSDLPCAGVSTPCVAP